MIMLLAERRSWALTSSPGEARFQVGANCDRKAVRGVIELHPVLPSMRMNESYIEAVQDYFRQNSDETKITRCGRTSSVREDLGSGW
jgi:hypothetical protein